MPTAGQARLLAVPPLGRAAPERPERRFAHRPIHGSGGRPLVKGIAGDGAATPSILATLQVPRRGYGPDLIQRQTEPVGKDVQPLRGSSVRGPALSTPRSAEKVRDHAMFERAI